MNGKRFTSRGAVLWLLAASALWMSWMIRPSHLHSSAQPFHSKSFLVAYGGLPDTSNALFTGSGKCAGCHGTDSNFLANRVGQTIPPMALPLAHDVNPTDQWRSSLMANSAKDPFWRAKVAHEVAVNPTHQVELEDKCTSCHAPLGHFNAHFLGEEAYSMVQLMHDTLAMDGVSCVACHQQSPNAGGTFSGILDFDTAMIYGPYGAGKDEPSLYDLPMNTYTGYGIAYGAHVDGSEVCAGCHSLVTSTADLEGNLTGATYVEQATYHEWLNSAYADDGAQPQECQDCHMPTVDGGVIISSGYAFLSPREPFSQHLLVGGNAQMLEIMRDNIETLGLHATEAQFDSTLKWTRDLLRNQTLELTIEDAGWEEDQGWLDLKLINLSGHKFPSGYPARRAWIEVLAHQGQDTIWHSGKWGVDGRIVGVDEGGLSVFQSHHEVLTEEDDVQVYELVAVDVTGAPTNILERAAASAKDNRLLPLGFAHDDPVYDTTSVVGEALGDMDFVALSAMGQDRLSYAMSAQPNPELDLELEVRVWYQSMPPRWVESMFLFSDSTIQAFKGMFESQGAAPELVAEKTLTVPVTTGIRNAGAWDRLVVYPNPAIDGRVRVKLPAQEGLVQWELYQADGTRVKHGQARGLEWDVELPSSAGTYLLKVHGEREMWSQRITRP